MSSQVMWYAARAGGMVAWALAAGSVVWGLALSTHALGRRPRPAWLFDLHRFRFLGGLAAVFTAVHVLAVLADSYVRFSLLNVLVPLTGGWHPLAVAWGVVGAWLLAAVELTSLARARLPRRLWRRVHYGGFALFALTTVHALAAGTDGCSPAFLLAVLAACALVAGLTGIRVAQASRRPAPRRAGPSVRSEPARERVVAAR
jgi:DMSO/TMAO reductase YedYZ heme-binding membrane subunit